MASCRYSLYCRNEPRGMARREACGEAIVRRAMLLWQSKSISRAAGREALRGGWHGFGVIHQLQRRARGARGMKW